MPRPARNRRRSLAPSLDSLEGRRLLSRVSLPFEAPADVRAENADRDDAHAPAVPRADPPRLVSAMALPSPRSETTRTTGSHPKPETDPPDGAWTENAEADGDPAPASIPVADIVAPVDPDSPAEPALSLVNGPPASDAARDIGRRWDAPPNTSVTGIAPASSTSVDPLPVPEGGDGERTAETPPETLSSPDGSVPEAPPSIEMPAGAGLIARVLPFSGETLTLAVDEALDRFDDLGVLDAARSLVTQRIATLGVACLATLGAIEIARRVHPRNSDRNRRRAPSIAMVPGLWPAR